MKLFIALFFLLSINTAVFSQHINSYIAAVRTPSGKQKGILREVTPHSLILEKGDSLIIIKAEDIRKITIYAAKKLYTYKSVFTYDPWAENNYERLPNSQIKKRKFNEEDPDFGEEVAGHVGTAAVNLAINAIAAPFHAINGSIEKIYIHQQLDIFETQRDNLTLYSAQYLAHPDYNAELKKIKLIKP